MGSMGFIENNKALCMLSSVININLLKSSKNRIKKFLYSSSACIYPSYAQKDYKSPKLKGPMRILLIQKMDTGGKTF